MDSLPADQTSDMSHSVSLRWTVYRRYDIGEKQKHKCGCVGSQYQTTGT